MVKQDRYYEVDRYLPHAVLATASVILIPAMVVVGLLMGLDGELAPLLAAVVGAALALIVAGIGSVLWSRSSGSLDVTFGELLIWGWVRRKRAEERATRNARLLGLDNDGRPAQRARSARSQQLTILGDLSSALESKDPYTHGHSQRVERHAASTAVALGLPLERVADIRRAATLHDVGKIRVPHRILRKRDVLTLEERKVIEQHTIVGAWLVSNVCKRDIVLAVRHHHERWDGRGYPDELSGENIPLYARIIAVADAYDAMTSTRPYRLAYDSRTAIEILEAEAGAQFDPAVVRAFVATVPDQVPMAAFLPFLGAGIIRKIAGSVRRLVDGSAISGAAATGAASVLVASIMLPVDAPSVRPERRPAAATPASGGPTTPGALLADATVDDDALDVVGKDGRAKGKADAKRDDRKREGRKNAGGVKRTKTKAHKGERSKKKRTEIVVMNDNGGRDKRSAPGPKPNPAPTPDPPNPRPTPDPPNPTPTPDPPNPTPTPDPPAPTPTPDPPPPTPTTDPPPPTPTPDPPAPYTDPRSPTQLAVEGRQVQGLVWTSTTGRPATEARA